MKNLFKPGLKIGLIKGGQLGKMLIQEMLNYDLESCVLDNDPSAPCKNCCTQFTLGEALDFEAVYNFGKKVDILTIEFEHVNVLALQKLEKEGVPVFPSSRILTIIQDKGLQKKFYKDNAIPTADFMLLENKKELEHHEYFFPAVQKTRKSGYDGKGIHKIHSADDIEKAFNEPHVLEKKIDFEKEISVIIARNAQGEISIFPVIELVFHPEKNVVEYLFAPAAISAHIEQKAVAIAKKIATTLDLIGIMAVEMFVTREGEVLVNEIAPRTHNSGHHTIEANYTSQFEQHIRAILNLPLGSTKEIMPAAMINLLGEEGHEGPVNYFGLEETLKSEGVFIHLYGKKITKPFRKMGHITVLAENIEKAKEKAILLKKTLKVIT